MKQELYAVVPLDHYPFMAIRKIVEFVDHLTIRYEEGSNRRCQYIKILPEAEALEIKGILRIKKAHYESQQKSLRDSAYESVKDTCDRWQIPNPKYIEHWAGEYYGGK